MEENYVKVRIYDVAMLSTPLGSIPAILLEDEEERVLPILIGRESALSIKRALEGEEGPVPLTHDMFLSALRECGAIVQSAVVYKMEGDRYYAKLVIEVNGERKEIEGRPSDAIAVAIRATAPLYVSNEIMDTMSVRKSEIAEGE